MHQALISIGLSPQYNTGFSNATGTSVDALQAEIDRLQKQMVADSSQMSTLDKSLTAWQNTINEDTERIRVLEKEKTLYADKQNEYTSLRYAKATDFNKKNRQGDGVYCKNGLGFGFGTNGNCLATNTSRIAQYKGLVDQRAKDIADLTARVNSSRTKIQQAEKDLVSVRERVNASQVKINDSLSRLEEAKGNNNAEVLQQKAQLEKAKEELARVEANAAYRAQIADQEGDALQASIDTKAGTMPMLIGFLVLVAAGLIWKYVFKGKLEA